VNGEIVHGDALEVMRRIPDGSFGTVVTSPPYNVRMRRDGSRNGEPPPRRAGTTWHAMHPGYDGYDDSMPAAEYEKWQQDCLREMWRLVREDGAIFYNHRWRHGSRPVDMMMWIHEAVPVRQIIIWDRRQSFNAHDTFYVPTYENIYLIAGPKWRRRVLGIGVDRRRPELKRELAPPMTAVWHIPVGRDTWHPAPFPVELPRRCLLTTGGDPGPVLDPFLGSGTTAVAAEQLGHQWVGIEQSAAYCDRARARIEREGRGGQRRLA